MDEDLDRYSQAAIDTILARAQAAIPLPDRQLTTADAQGYKLLCNTFTPQIKGIYRDT